MVRFPLREPGNEGVGGPLVLAVVLAPAGQGLGLGWRDARDAHQEVQARKRAQKSWQEPLLTT